MLSRIKSLVRRMIRRWGYELTPIQAALPKAVKADYDPILDILGKYRFKFLDVKTFLPTTIKRAYQLGLHQSKPQHILDIGTGVGYFPVVCKYYGHTAIAIDQDGNEVFEDATKWLKVDRRHWEIKPFEPIAFLGQRFDLITAFMVNFDRVKESDYETWGIKEWEFFLSDLAENHLNDGGRLVLLLNPQGRENAGVLKYFAEKGATIKEGWVEFKTLSAFKQVPV
jgi:hypothetical protein